jgi:hypothetical protein
MITDTIQKDWMLLVNNRLFSEISNKLKSSSVSPSSILVRVTQTSGLRWHMYGASKEHPNRISSIYISNVKSSRMYYIHINSLTCKLNNSTDIAEFEELVSRLAMWQAKRHLKQGRSSRLVSIEPHFSGDGIISVLNSKAYYSTHSSSLKTSSTDSQHSEMNPDSDTETNCRITFRVNGQHFVTTAASTYSVLHYRSLPGSVVRLSTENIHAGSFMVHQAAAELIFRAGNARPVILDDMSTQYFISCMITLPFSRRKCLAN